MSEYIEREALLRALSKEVEYDDDGEQEINSDTVFIAIEGFPAADVAPVVRCKDCRFLGDENLGLHDCDHHRGPMRVELDDFCSYGERKETD